MNRSADAFVGISGLDGQRIGIDNFFFSSLPSSTANARRAREWRKFSARQFSNASVSQLGRLRLC